MHKLMHRPPRPPSLGCDGEVWSSGLPGIWGWALHAHPNPQEPLVICFQSHFSVHFRETKGKRSKLQAPMRKHCRKGHTKIDLNVLTGMILWFQPTDCKIHFYFVVQMKWKFNRNKIFRAKSHLLFCI